MSASGRIDAGEPFNDSARCTSILNCPLISNPNQQHGTGGEDDGTSRASLPYSRSSSHTVSMGIARKCDRNKHNTLVAKMRETLQVEPVAGLCADPGGARPDLPYKAVGCRDLSQLQRWQKSQAHTDSRG